MLTLPSRLARQFVDFFGRRCRRRIGVIRHFPEVGHFDLIILACLHRVPLMCSWMLQFAMLSDGCHSRRGLRRVSARSLRLRSRLFCISAFCRAAASY